jgi:hypothetical protein
MKGTCGVATVPVGSREDRPDVRSEDVVTWDSSLWALNHPSTFRSYVHHLNENECHQKEEHMY